MRFPASLTKNFLLRHFGAKSHCVKKHAARFQSVCPDRLHDEFFERIAIGYRADDRNQSIISDHLKCSIKKILRSLLRNKSCQAIISGHATTAAHAAIQPTGACSM
jgi:hypothetical protein